MLQEQEEEDADDNFWGNLWGQEDADGDEEGGEEVNLEFEACGNELRFGGAGVGDLEGARGGQRADGADQGAKS